MQVTLGVPARMVTLSADNNPQKLTAYGCGTQGNIPVLDLWPRQAGAQGEHLKVLREDLGQEADVSTAGPASST